MKKTEYEDYKDDRVDVFIPKLTKDQEDVVVWVNNDRYQIKRGVKVSVPRAVAKVIERSERLREESYAYMDKASEIKQ